MRLTTKGRYAARAILDLALSGSLAKPTRLQEISERQKISLHYLEQLFRRLRASGIVKSTRGPGGGYILARPLDEILMRDVLNSVGENIDPAKDLVGSDDLKSNTLEFILLRTYFQDLGTVMEDYLSSTSLGDLVRKARGEKSIEKTPEASSPEISQRPIHSRRTPEMSS